jgi:hypothetical protein
MLQDIKIAKIWNVFTKAWMKYDQTAQDSKFRIMQCNIIQLYIAPDRQESQK